MIISIKIYTPTGDEKEDDRVETMIRTFLIDNGVVFDIARNDGRFEDALWELSDGIADLKKETVGDAFRRIFHE